MGGGVSAAASYLFNQAPPLNMIPAPRLATGCRWMPGVCLAFCACLDVGSLVDAVGGGAGCGSAGVLRGLRLSAHIKRLLRPCARLRSLRM